MKFLAVSLLLASSFLVAQHDHQAAQIIDGAFHPQLIPDNIAYRLYFVAVATMPNDSTEAKTRQSANLRMIGFEDSDPDLQVLVRELEKFKTRYTEMITRYNAEATTATEAGIQPDQRAFLAQRDSLVATTRRALKRQLSPEGLKRLDFSVQEEKRHMKLTIEEGQ
jgi:hypothetical protein